MPALKLIEPILSKIKGKLSLKYRFDHQFANKNWDGLWGLDELARYSIITGYTRFFCKDPRIADLGCGEGVLQQKFGLAEYSHYLGIDFSEVAIERAKNLENNKTYFQVADLNTLQINGLFDTIIFNESLYYLSNPKKAIRALYPNLKPGGIFIISMHKVGNERETLWSELDEMLNLKDKTTVTNRTNTTWTVAVYTVRA